MIDDCIGCAMSGLAADARTMIDHGRVETQVCIIFQSNSFQLCANFIKFGNLLLKIIESMLLESIRFNVQRQAPRHV